MNIVNSLFKRVGLYIQPKLATLKLKIPAYSSDAGKVLGIGINGEIIPTIATASGYSYKGAILINTDFPLIAGVTDGDWYNVTAVTVTDNAGITYTNTGLIFVSGDEIYWDGSTWQDYGNVKLSLTNNTTWVGNALNVPTEESVLMAANTIKVNATTGSAKGTDLALTNNQVLGRLSGNIVPIDLVTSSLSIQSFNVSPYTDLALEANWINNRSTVIASTGDEFLYGGFDSGTIGYIFGTESGWIRGLSNNLLDAISSATLIAQLVTTGNWTKVSDGLYISTASVTTGDLNQEYYVNGNLYKCIAGHPKHTWLRIGTLDVITVSTDFIEIGEPLLGVVTTNTFTRAIATKYTSISVKNNVAVAGTICIGTSAGASDIVPVTNLAASTTVIYDLLMTIDQYTDYSTTQTYHVTITTTGAVIDVNLKMKKQLLYM